jgi:DNA polymerase III delta subunit
MKLLLLHGPAIVSSRKKLTELKQKFDPQNIVIFEKGSDSKDILANLQTVSMFDENRLVIMENPQEVVDYNSLAGSELLTLVFWFDKEIDTKKWPNVEALLFPEVKEVSVFPLLDKLGNRDKTAFLEMDKLKKADFDTQYFITMIFYLLRNLVATPKIAKDFVKQKNARMRRNFTEDELVDLYKFVLETDFKIKKGLLENPQAQFQLVNKFITG